MRNRRICSQWFPKMMRVRGWDWCVTIVRTSPLRPRMDLGSGSVSTGMRACMAKSWLMKRLSALECTKNGAETDCWPQRSMHGSVKQATAEQEEEALANAPTCVDELSPLGQNGQLARTWPAWPQYRQSFVASQRFCSAWENRVHRQCPPEVELGPELTIQM